MSPTVQDWARDFKLVLKNGSMIPIFYHSKRTYDFDVLRPGQSRIPRAILAPSSGRVFTPHIIGNLLRGSQITKCYPVDGEVKTLTEQINSLQWRDTFHGSRHHELSPIRSVLMPAPKEVTDRLRYVAVYLFPHLDASKV